MTEIKKSEKAETEEGNSLISLLSSILKEIAEFKGWEVIFQGLLYTFLIFAIYNLQIIYEFHTSSEWAHIPKYSIYDFKLALIMVAVFLVFWFCLKLNNWILCRAIKPHANVYFSAWLKTGLILLNSPLKKIEIREPKTLVIGLEILFTTPAQQYVLLYECLWFFPAR